MKLFYRDQNHRVYEVDGVRRDHPYEEGYYLPIEFVDGKAKYGKLSKDKKTIKFGSNSWKVFTEQEMIDNIYIQNNVYEISRMVLDLRDAVKLKAIKEILQG